MEVPPNNSRLLLPDSSLSWTHVLFRFANSTQGVDACFSDERLALCAKRLSHVVLVVGCIGIETYIGTGAWQRNQHTH